MNVKLKQTKYKKISEQLEEFQKYISQRLTISLKHIIDLHTNTSDYGCLYCKELTHVYNLTEKFNCSFKLMSKQQLSHFSSNLQEYPLPSEMISPTKLSKFIYFMGILSDESINEMTEHTQYLVCVLIDPLLQSFSFLPPIREVKINQYDYLLSKSRQYKGLYSFGDLSGSSQKIYAISKDEILEKLNCDNLVSLPKELFDYYHQNFSHLSYDLKKEEVAKIFPFLQASAIDFFCTSEQNSKIFLYANEVIKTSFRNNLADVFQYQDYSMILRFLPLLDNHDIHQLTSAPIEKQHELLCNLCFSGKGMSSDEFIDFMVNQINDPQCNCLFIGLFNENNSDNHDYDNDEEYD